MKQFFAPLALIIAACTSAMAQAPPKPKSDAELKALQAMFGAQTPDTRIQAAQNVLTSFADTEFKSVALYFITASYEQKGDFPNTVIWGERTLEGDPKNFEVMLMLARGWAAHTRENDLDKDEKLGKATKYANSAMAAIEVAVKPNPNLTDDQWAGVKKDAIAQAHEALGLVAMVGKNYPAAATEFQASLDSATKPDPSTMVRLAAADNQMKKYDDALALLAKVNAMPDLPVAVKQVAQAERVRANMGKNGGSTTSAPVTPPAATTPPATTPPATIPAPHLP